ncbi:hypothetical protein [Bradyrhizobium sp. ORS 111]|uniref:hypothetical protein n=1 Tax=Bradyrhizobium sp. ORS 111 TaxID=1685958 RepID=UPI00388F2A58
MNRITIVKTDGSVYEVHTLPRDACPILSAGHLARCHRARNFRYQIEASGQKSEAFTAVEIEARAALQREFGAA